MKRIFEGIGILVAVFSIFYFLLCVDKMVYVNNDMVYDFKLSRTISGRELKDLAESVDVTVQLYSGTIKFAKLHATNVLP